MESQSVQQDVRSAYLRGSVAQTTLGIFWLTAAALGTWGKESYAIVMIVLHLMGRLAGLPVPHPMNQLIFGIALIIPFSLIGSLLGLQPYYLLGGAIVIGSLLPDIFSPGGWFTGVVLIL